MRKFGNKGFTLVESLVAIALITVFIFMAFNYTTITTGNTNLTRYIGTKNRVLATIRESIALPATLRASMMAANGATPVNPVLLACAGGNPPLSCPNGGPPIPFTLFSPLIGRDPSGNIVGVQPISDPLGKTPPSIRIDSFGSICTTPSPDCALLIYTSMTAKCGVPIQPAVPPSPINLEIAPLATCTFAEVIEVTYTIQLDPAVTNADSTMSSFINPVTNVIAVPVLAISGNLPK